MSVIVPTRNEASNIEPLLARLQEASRRHRRRGARGQRLRRRYPADRPPDCRALGAPDPGPRAPSGSALGRARRSRSRRLYRGACPGVRGDGCRPPAPPEGLGRSWAFRAQVPTSSSPRVMWTAGGRRPGRVVPPHRTTHAGHLGREAGSASGASGRLGSDERLLPGPTVVPGPALASPRKGSSSCSSCSPGTRGQPSRRCPTALTSGTRGRRRPASKRDSPI